MVSFQNDRHRVHLDGARTEYVEVECAEATLPALLRELFEGHWGKVIFGPCIGNAEPPVTHGAA
jgi:hypothetical protein